MRKYKRSKLERQEWWDSLSLEQKMEYSISKKQKKEDDRRDRSIRLMSQFTERFDCKDCIHRLTMSCTDYMPNGCEYFDDLINNRTAPLSVVPQINQPVKKTTLFP